MNTAQSSNCFKKSKEQGDCCELKPLEPIVLKTQTFQYEKNISIIPFPGNSPEKGRFNNTDAAVSFIFKHCLKYHGNTKKTTVFKYFPLVEILDLADGIYMPLTLFSTKSLNSLYMRQCRKLSNHK